MLRIISIPLVLLWVYCQQPKNQSQTKAVVVEVESSESNMQEKIETITYEAASRGSFFSITITNQRIEKASDRSKKNLKTQQCSKKDWTIIQDNLQNIDLNTIDTLKAPTNYKSVDRAMRAKLMLQSSTKTYTSVSFDHGKPPKELQQLANTILLLGENIE